MFSAGPGAGAVCSQHLSAGQENADKPALQGVDGDPQAWGVDSDLPSSAGRAIDRDQLLICKHR